MTESEQPRKKLITARRPALQHAVFIENTFSADEEGKSPLVLKLTFKASAQAMAELESAVAEVTDSHFSEKDTREDFYSCSVPIQARSDAVDVAEAIFDKMPYRLKNVRTQIDAEQFAEAGENSVYTPQVILHAKKDRYDLDNIVGDLSLDLIKRKAGSSIEVGMAVDPAYHEPGSARLIDILDTPNSRGKALLVAEKKANELDKTFGLSLIEQGKLKLTGLSGETVSEDDGEKRVMNAVIATLQGDSEEAIDAALKILRRRHGNQIAPHDRDTEKHSVQLVMGSDVSQYLDPTALLAALHISTSCELPITLKPGVLHNEGFKHPYNPSLGVYLRDGVKDDQGLLREASARYSGSLLPGRNDVITVGDSDNVKVVLPEAFDKEDTAFRKALQAHERVSRNLNAPEVSGPRK